MKNILENINYIIFIVEKIQVLIVGTICIVYKLVK